jgi:hypothetical protein
VAVIIKVTPTGKVKSIIGQGTHPLKLFNDKDGRLIGASTREYSDLEYDSGRQTPENASLSYSSGMVSYIKQGTEIQVIIEE